MPSLKCLKCYSILIFLMYFRFAVLTAYHSWQCVLITSQCVCEKIGFWTVFTWLENLLLYFFLGICISCILDYFRTLSVSCNANNQEKGMEMAFLNHFFDKVVQLKIDCESLQRNCCIGKQISKHQFGK